MTALLSEDALGLVEAEVRELIRRRGLDPVLELERTRELVDAAVRDYDQRSARGVLPALALHDPDGPVLRGRRVPAVTPMVRVPVNGVEKAQWHAKQVLDALDAEGHGSPVPPAA